MNKELILKYKTEFDHWLKEGKLLTTIKDEDSMGKWEEVTNNNNWNNPNRIYVLNDEYAEFRKALAEGKTIQYLEIETNSWRDCVTWIHPSRTFNNPASNYRIKPEEPEFKLGEFIQQGNFIIKVDYFDGSIYWNKAGDFILGRDAKKWEPKEGDYVWDFDTLVKVRSTLNNIGEYKVYNSYEDWEYTISLEYIEPFIGELPNRLKDKINEI